MAINPYDVMMSRSPRIGSRYAVVRPTRSGDYGSIETSVLAFELRDMVDRRGTLIVEAVVVGGPANGASLRVQSNTFEMCLRMLDRQTLDATDAADEIAKMRSEMKAEQQLVKSGRQLALEEFERQQWRPGALEPKIAALPEWLDKEANQSPKPTTSTVAKRKLLLLL